MVTKMQPSAIPQNAQGQFLCTGCRLFFPYSHQEKQKTGNGSNLQLACQYQEVVASGPSLIRLKSNNFYLLLSKSFPCLLHSSSKFKVINLGIMSKPPMMPRFKIAKQHILLNFNNYEPTFLHEVIITGSIDSYPDINSASVPHSPNKYVDAQRRLGREHVNEIESQIGVHFCSPISLCLQAYQGGSNFSLFIGKL